MASDPGGRQADAPKPDFKLPDVLEVRVRRVPFEPPKHRNFESALARFKEAVEFVVRTDAPIPVRALGPALYVGDAAVVEVKELEEGVYRFLALNLDALVRGAPISLGWTGQAEGEWQRTKFVYEG